jgi:hypothetical protein
MAGRIIGSKDRPRVKVVLSSHESKILPVGNTPVAVSQESCIPWDLYRARSGEPVESIDNECRCPASRNVTDGENLRRKALSAGIDAGHPVAVAYPRLQPA